MSAMHGWAETFSRLALTPGFFGAIGLFLVATLDELVAFIPSSLVLTAEILFLKVPLSIAGLIRLSVFVGLPIALGSTLGSLPLFALAYAGGKPAIEKARGKWKLSWTEVEKFSAKFRGDWTDQALFFLLRATPLVPTLPVTVVSGVMRMRTRTYIFLTVFGILVRVVITLALLKIGGEAVITHAFNGGL